MTTKPDREEGQRARRSDWISLPNAICVVRLGLSPGLVVLALTGQRMPVVGLFLVLSASDWIDGKLAIWLDQRTKIGPLLDTLADGALYASLLAALIVLDADRLGVHAAFLAVGLFSWLLMVGFGMAKFRRWPAVHARTSKIAWGVVLGATLVFLTGWADWPIRVAAIAGTIANLDSLVILAILPEWRSDVPNVVVASKVRREVRERQPVKASAGASPRGERAG